ncbi:ABC transporter permease [Phosphitispora sp. TUW77]|uniref:ABC transporter permease n=1 Tax=Phosphitispora sp. TUW77 TaxID=3152361 RepID=UPI003AB1FB99
MLRRKLWRDIRGNYGAYLAVISVSIIGLMLYVSMALILGSLKDSVDSYYSEYNFAEGFARIVRGPQGLLEDIRSIEGIDRVSGRLVIDVLVNKKTGEENTTLRLVSFDGGKNDLNKFKLEEGKIPSEEGRQILVSPAFLSANEYKIGDVIPLIINATEIQFTISGTANSPEYVYEIPSGQMLTPDPKGFGVAFVPYVTVAQVLGMDGQVNDIVFTLDRDVSFSSIKRPVENILGSYGLTQLYPRKNQLSHSMLNQEIVGLEATVNTSPVIFLLVAASILYIMLRRMVEQQRGLIGILKAFGFTDREIITHYLGYAVFTGGFGGLGGGLLGTWLSYYFAKVYQQFYNIPGLTGRISPGYILSAALLSIAFSLVAGYQGCKGVLRLRPAEAMRPPAPKVGKKTLVERIGFFWDMLTTLGKMAVRNVFRSKQRSFLALFGVACAFSLMVASGASFDAIYYLINFQYEKVEKYDIKVSLKNYVDLTEAVTGAHYMDGVLKAEPMLEVPVTIANKWREKDTVITGLPQDASLYHLLTDKGKQVRLPEQGMVISTQMAKVLDIKQGDAVTVKPFLGDRDERQVVVRQVVPQYVGLGAYMDIDSLSSLLRAPPVASSVLIRVEEEKMSGVREELRSGKNVSAIHDKNKLKSQFEELMETSQASQYILVFFSFIMGFAIVYNVNLISLSEREREMASLMVLGMTEGEVARILLFEQGFLGLAAIIAGVPLSYGILYAIVSASGSDIYNMPLVIELRSFMMGLLGTLMFLVAAQWKMKGRVAKLSMLDVLKQQD